MNATDLYALQELHRVERPRRRRRWVRPVAAFAVVMLALSLSTAVAARVAVPYYALSPGTVNEVDQHLTIPDNAVVGEDGELMFLTVFVEEVSALEYVGAWFDGDVSLRPLEELRPPGETDEQRVERGRAQINQSSQTASVVALTHLGYDVTFTGQGALLVGLVPDSPAAAAGLEVGEVIIAVNGTPVQLADDLVSVLSGLAPGDAVALTVEATTPEGLAGATREVQLTLAEHPEVTDRGFIGVAPDTLNFGVDLPFPVEFDTSGIGGPSAGMMFALGVIDQLTESDLTRGHRIAGTGTLSPDGDVGPIGGVRQKVFAARNADAEIVLVPAENYDDAIAAAGDDIEVVAVDTIDDALAFLEGLPAA